MESGHLLTIFILIAILSSLYFVSAENSSNSSNQTNGTVNITNISKNISQQNTSVSILIKSPSSIDLGTRIPDGSEKSYDDIGSIDLSADNVSELSIKCDGDFVDAENSSNTIALNNFEYDGFGNSSLSKTPFTTSFQSVRSWQGNITVPVNFYLTVPVGTRPGSYSTTIYYQVS
jgi:hypothetical protein